MSNTYRPTLAPLGKRGDVRLTPKKLRWLRFAIGIFLPGLISSVLILGFAVRFVGSEDPTFLSILSLAPVPLSAALAIAFGVWFAVRKQLTFSSYESYLRPAIRLVCLVLVLTDVLVPLAFGLAPIDSVSEMHISLLVWLWLTPGLAIFGFPLLFVTVFFFMSVFFAKEHVEVSRSGNLQQFRKVEG